MTMTSKYKYKLNNSKETKYNNLSEFILECDLVSKSLFENEVLKIAGQTKQSILKAALNYGYLVRKNYYSELKKAGIIITDIRKEEINPEYILKLDINYLLNNIVVPVRMENNELIVAVSDPFSTDLEVIFDTFKCNIRMIACEDLDIIWMIHKYGGRALVEKAVFTLYDKNPDESAIVNITKKQLWFIFFFGILFIIGISYYTYPMLLTLNIVLSLIFLGMISFKLFLSIVGAQSELNEKITPEEVKNIKDSELPRYTILLPVYKESEVLTKLVGNLLSLDYPKHLLDIKLLLEEDDDLTLNTVRNLDFPAVFDTIVIPFQMPKTKPKACNYGLFFSNGKYLTIYDAEDIPDADQLKKAVLQFNKLPENYLCIQCALNYFNRNENLLTRMFTLEYSYWFDYALQGLDILEIPIPLGGTSNHFKLDKLIELGAWDPFNVTEDADLGTRAYAEGYKVSILNSTTYEEANNNVGNWIRQRSRWIKGYMQTYLVYMRHPLKLLSALEVKGFLGFHFFIGGTVLTFLLYPILLLFFIFSITYNSTALNQFYPDSILFLTTFNLVVGNLLVIYINMMAVMKRSLYDLIIFSLLNPLYWLLHSISAYKGLWQLINNPFYWEKTNHGLTKQQS